MDPKASESLPAFFLKEAGAKIKAGLCKGLTNLAFSDSTLRFSFRFNYYFIFCFDAVLVLSDMDQFTFLIEASNSYRSRSHCWFATFGVTHGDTWGVTHGDT